MPGLSNLELKVQDLARSLTARSNDLALFGREARRPHDGFERGIADQLHGTAPCTASELTIMVDMWRDATLASSTNID